MTLACELVDVVIVADVDDKERVDNSLVEIMTLKSVRGIKVEVLSRFKFKFS